MKHSLLMLAAGSAMLVAAAPGPRAVKIVRNSPNLQFTYAWPKQAAAIPAIDAMFRSDMAKAWRSAQAVMQDELKLTKAQKRSFNPQFFSKVWTLAGESRSLLSLQFQVGEFTGGAHGNSNNGALLWDRTFNREIALQSLFASPNGLTANTRAAYCAGLDAERREKRQGEQLAGMFNECPKYSELAIAPVDKNGDGRFDRFVFVAAPYTAGPYVEGEYDVAVPVTAALIAGLKPAYRSSFAVQRQ